MLDANEYLENSSLGVSLGSEGVYKIGYSNDLLDANGYYKL